MAVEVENTSQVEELLRVLKRRLWWILIPAGILITLGVTYAIVVPKKYVARAQVMVYDRPATTVRGSAPTTAEGRVAPHKLKAPQRIRSVLDKLKWLEYEELPTEVEAAEYRAKIDKNIQVSVPVMEANVQQQVVKVSFSHTRADLAEQFLLELVRQWQDEVLAKNARQLSDERDQWIEQEADLLKKKEDLAAGLLRLHRDNRIPPKTRNGDNGQSIRQLPAFEKVTRLQQRLEANNTEYELAEIQLERLKSVERRMPDTVPIDSAGAAGEGDSQLIALQTQLDQAIAARDAGRWAPGHSNYIQAEIKIASLRERIEQAMGVSPSQSDHFQYVRPNEAKQEKREQIAFAEENLAFLLRNIGETQDKLTEAQKDTDRLQNVYSQIGELEADQLLVQENLKSVSGNLLRVTNQLTSQAGPQGNPFSPLESVTASKKPIEPNAWLISLFSVVLGIGAGLGLAVLVEFSKNCFRSINDIARAMEIPVLGAINRIETRRQRHLKRVQKLVVSVCMLLTMGLVGFTLWAWVLNPHLLKASVVESIDRLREVLG